MTLDTGEDKVTKLKDRMKCYFVSMNAAYIANLGLAFWEYWGPFCTETRLYPKCMTVAAVLYVINYGYHRYLHSNHYFL